MIKIYYFSSVPKHQEINKRRIENVQKFYTVQVIKLVVIRPYSKSNLGAILSVNCKFIRDSTPT